MPGAKESLAIVVVDDDDEDYMLFERAVRAAGVENRLVRLKDGGELRDCLLRETADPDRPPPLVLLDLKMPRVDGHEALRLVRAEEALRRVPIVVFSCSPARSDVERSYRLGANSFLRKPPGFSDLVKLVETVRAYWLETALLA